MKRENQLSMKSGKIMPSPLSLSHSYKAQKRFGRVMMYIAVCIYIIITVLPFFLVLDASFQNEWAIKTGAFKLIPREVTLQNYIDLLFETSGVTAFRNNLVNSLKVGVGACVLSITISVIGAYGLSRYQFPGKEGIARAMLFMYVFPTILAIYPIYSVLATLKLIDTHLGLILVHTTLVAPFCIWLMRSFFDAIPKEIEEAAKVDGASRWRIILTIIIPLAAPGILAAGMYALIYSWGEYMFSSILINSGTKKTIPLALAAYMSHTDQKWGRLLAGCSLNFVPLLIIFMPLLKNFLKGFMAGAVKE